MPVAFDLSAWMIHQLAAVEHALDTWVSVDASPETGHHAPAELMAAMRYAVLDGGKRLRPLLVLAAFEAVSGGSDGASNPVALRAACAVELIHAYSLVHDDMPCMDNDVLRRGKPTVHVEFGVANALLAGDALQVLAFELLTPDVGVVSASQQAQLCRLLSRAAGCAGMAGGQAIDLASVGLTLSEAQLRQMHRLKTGALLQACVVMGATCGNANTAATAALKDYGAAVGLAFQVVDDVLDVIADSETLGKTAGKDAHNEKPTYVSLMGLERARAYACELQAQAMDALTRSGLGDVRALESLAAMVIQRTC